MTEQIEVFGQFDVRKDDVITESETILLRQNSIDKALITNTFSGDQLNAALDAVNNKKTYVRTYENQSKKFYISRKDCPVRNFCEELGGRNNREEAIQMFDALFWGSWIACNEMPDQAKEWLDARIKDYKDGIKMDFICDCRKFRGNDADKTQASEMTRAEYPFDCHGYTLKKYIEDKSNLLDN